MTPGDTLTDCQGRLTRTRDRLLTVTDREVTYQLEGSQFKYRVGRDRTEVWIEKGFWKEDKDKQKDE